MRQRQRHGGSWLNKRANTAPALPNLTENFQRGVYSQVAENCPGRKTVTSRFFLVWYRHSTDKRLKRALVCDGYRRARFCGAKVSECLKTANTIHSSGYTAAFAAVPRSLFGPGQNFPNAQSIQKRTRGGNQSRSLPMILSRSRRTRSPNQPPKLHSVQSFPFRQRCSESFGTVHRVLGSRAPKQW